MATDPLRAPTKSPGRNDPCWCGSGRKFKRCHHPDGPVTSATPDPAELRGGRGGASVPRLRPGAVLRRVRPGRVGPPRAVPGGIPRPPYAETGDPGPEADGRPKTADEIERLRHACRAAREVLAAVEAAVAPGVTTDELDAIAHSEAIARGAYPSPLNYKGFPKSLCTSVNEVICHGIPDDRPLADGDLLNCDVTVYLDGMHGDNSVMIPVGTVDGGGERLMRVAHEAMMRGIGVVRPGARVREIGRAIEEHASAHGYASARAFVGHGVGADFHTDPIIYHYDNPDATAVLEPGMTFTVEPMLNEGTWQHRMWKDGWTAVTADLRRSAQWEHTVLVTDRGVEVLTLPAGEPQPFPH